MFGSTTSKTWFESVVKSMFGYRIGFRSTSPVNPTTNHSLSNESPSKWSILTLMASAVTNWPCSQLTASIRVASLSSPEPVSPLSPLAP